VTVAGLIVNPAAGRDIRRLVADAPLMSHREKASLCLRALEGLAAMGVERVHALDDGVGILGAACAKLRAELAVELLPIELEGSTDDTVAAARLLEQMRVPVIVTLGGDGTNRAVACGCSQTPLVALSTGTNNVFPSLVDGTIAGMAAGLVATGRVDLDRATTRAKRVEVVTAGRIDFALIDAAVVRDRFVGSRAVWDVQRVRALVLARAEPWAVGLSSIGGRLHPVGAHEPAGLYLELGEGETVLAPIAPGRVVEVGVAQWRVLELDEDIELPACDGVVALDGEREVPLDGVASARVARRGPLVVDIRAALAAASLKEVSALDA
jgi:predicted polyphosphate/ATP-dependent NAD kinase